MRQSKLLNYTFLLFFFVLAGCEQSKKQITSKEELEALRVDLKERVAKGDLSQAEAVVAIAEAQKQLKWSGSKKKKGKSKLSSELRTLGADLKEKVTAGEMSEKEAAEQWLKANRKASSNKKATDSIKKTEK